MSMVSALRVPVFMGSRRCAVPRATPQVTAVDHISQFLARVDGVFRAGPIRESKGSREGRGRGGDALDESVRS